MALRPRTARPPRPRPLRITELMTIDARALVDEHGVIMLASHATLPSLVTAIAGEPVRGSWWAHAHGHEIFRIATALEEYALVTKLVEGKVTFVSPRLVPALLTIVNDPNYRARKLATLDDDARALLKKLPVRGAPKKPREALERTLLVRAESVHTASGKHETVLSAWGAASGVGIEDAYREFGKVLRGVKSAFDV